MHQFDISHHLLTFFRDFPNFVCSKESTFISILYLFVKNMLIYLMDEQGKESCRLTSKYFLSNSIPCKPIFYTMHFCMMNVLSGIHLIFVNANYFYLLAPTPAVRGDPYHWKNAFDNQTIITDTAAFGHRREETLGPAAINTFFVL